MKMELSKVTHVSKITQKDKKLFESFYKKNKNSLDFSNSWLYTIQSTIFGAFKFYDGETLIPFTTKKPNELPYAIVQYLGHHAIQKAFKLAKILSQISHQEVIFKNLTESQFKSLHASGCTDYKKGDYWNKFYKYDDDTYPETIIDLKDLISLRGGQFKTMRYRVNYFVKRYNHTVKNYSHKDSLKEGREVIEKWKGVILQRYSDYLKEDQMILHSADIHNKFLVLVNSGKVGKGCISKIIYADGEPVALGVAYKISDVCIGLYTNVTTKDLKGLSERIIFELLKEALKQGYKYANLGGSEFESLLKFKDKFKPIKYIQKTHAVLYPE